MIPSTGLGTTAGENKTEIENQDPLVVTPSRKHDSDQYTASTTPATPSSRSTPLHKRFLEKVTMSPGTSSPPPRTPTRSPKRGAREAQPQKQTLEVGQNGFYFSIEIPEKKITSRRAATPDTTASGRLTPSPEKVQRSEVKTGGRVKDILRRNLFGSPTKQTLKSGQEPQVMPKLQNADREANVRPSKIAGAQLWAGDSERSENGQGAPKEGAAKPMIAPFATHDAHAPSQSLASPAPTVAVATVHHAAMPTEHQQTPKALTPAPPSTTDAALGSDAQKTPVESTPSNIGHLMANHSSTGPKVQTQPTSGLESMPTPLRKMSERLGLHVVQQDKFDGKKVTLSATRSPEQALRSPISALDLRDNDSVVYGSAAHAAVCESDMATVPVMMERESTMRSENRLRQFLPSPISTVFPVVSSRPGTATTSPFPSPSTPSRPGLSNRAKSFGTPSRLRSSIKEDMHNVQESLKRSLGAGAFQANSSRPTTPLTPTITTPTVTTPTITTPAVVCVESVPSPTKLRSNPKTTARPKSMVGSPKPSEADNTGVATRRNLTTAARKPRPKSMIIGAAKMLEAVASQIDSPRERAKLRAAATPSARQDKRTASRPGTAASATRDKPATSRPSTAASVSCDKPATSRPGTASSTLRGTKPAAAKPPASKPQPKPRTTKTTVPRSVTQPKRAVPAASAANLEAPKQRTASAETIATQLAHWKATDEIRPAPPPRAPIKTPNQHGPISRRSRSRAVKTPEPKDPKADSGTAQSYTPPGNPTRLPSPVKAPSRTRLVLTAAPAMRKLSTPSEAPKAALTDVKAVQNEARPVQTPLPKRLGSYGDPNAVRTPSKGIQSSLDAAIDRKIREDRERMGLEWV